MERTAPGITESLADWAAGLRWEDLPPAVVERMLLHFVDTLGLALRGNREEPNAVLLKWLAGQGVPGGRVVAGTGLRLLPQYAALANGAAAHGLELDDTHNDGSIHPGAAIFPACLALAAELDLDGRRLLTAAVAGYEVSTRLAAALTPKGHYGRGFHPTGTCNTFGVAVGAAHLYGLDHQATTWALGIAGSQAAGSHEYHGGGGWTKRFHPGWAAHSGLIAGSLAAAGFEGPRTIIEGREGTLRAYTDGAEPERLLAGLGREWAVLRTALKPHACCRYMQGPIDAILHLANTYNLSPEQVERVEIGLLAVAIPIVAEPHERKSRPVNAVEAPFSMVFGAAAALVRRRALLEEFSADALHDPLINAAREKIRCYHEPDLDREYPRRWPAVVTLILTDGRRLQHRVDTPLGDPENPLSEDVVLDKFRYVTAPYFSTKLQNEVIGGARGLLEGGRVKNLEEQLHVSHS